MVEYRRSALREDGAHLPAAHPGSVMGGTPASHSSRHCGNQRRTGGSPLEEVRCFDCSSYAYSLMKHYTRTAVGHEKAGVKESGEQCKADKEFVISSRSRRGNCASCRSVRCQTTLQDIPS